MRRLLLLCLAALCLAPAASAATITWDGWVRVSDVYQHSHLQVLTDGQCSGNTRTELAVTHHLFNQTRRVLEP